MIISVSELSLSDIESTAILSLSSMPLKTDHIYRTMVLLSDLSNMFTICVIHLKYHVSMRVMSPKMKYNVV